MFLTAFTPSYSLTHNGDDAPQNSFLHYYLSPPFFKIQSFFSPFLFSFHYATSRKVAGSIPDGVIGMFHWHIPSGPHCGPGVDSASDRNEYKEYFLGVKAACL